MSSTVVITLDTTAPVVAFGDPTGRLPGQVFHVGYSLNEGTVDGALLELADSTTLGLTNLGSSFEVALPADAAKGRAFVHVTVTDDVGNTATRTLNVTLGTLGTLMILAGAGGIVREDLAV